MKVLILANGTGGGHNAAANALKEEFIAQGHEAVMMDPFSLKGRTSGRLTSKFVNNTYTMAVQKIPHVFGFFYGLGEMFNSGVTDGPVKTPVYYWNYNMAEKLYAHIKKEKYDAILAAHPYPGEMMAAIHARDHHTPPVFWVSTDYHCIPLTRESMSDNYVIASSDLMDEYIRYGIPEYKLYPIGIPVRRECRTNLTQQQARKALGLDPDKTYFMISGGAVGSGKILEGVTLLAGRYLTNPNVRIIAICGANGFLYKQMKRLFSDKVIMMEHTDRMIEYMTAADILITKPGGLSSSEAASIGKPIIFISPIPGGLESSNVRFFQEHGMAVYAKSINKDLLKCVDEIMQNKDFAAQMVENQRKYVNRDAASDIVNLVVEKVECGSEFRKDLSRSKKAMDRKLEQERLEQEAKLRAEMQEQKAKMKADKAAEKAAEKERKSAAKRAAAAAKKAAKEKARQARQKISKKDSEK